MIGERTPLEAWLSDPSAGGPPADYAIETLPRLLASTSDAMLDRCLRAVGDAHPELFVALAEASADRAVARGDVTAAVTLLRRALDAAPESQALRVKLVGLLYGRIGHHEFAELLAPALPLLVANLRTFRLHTSWLIVAAHEAERGDIVIELVAALAASAETVTLFGLGAEIADRYRWLGDMGAWPLADGSLQRDPPVAAWFATNERDMLDAVDVAFVEGSGIGWTLEHATVLAAVARRRVWTAAYRRAVALAAALARGISDDDRFLIRWLEVGLPGAAGALVLRRAAANPDAARDPLARFRESPSLETATAVWHAQAGAGDSASILRFAAVDAREIETARLAEQAVDEEPNAPPLWVFMTWRDDAARLLSNLANYWEPGGRIIVSIGGAGKPADLDRAIAALLLPGVMAMNRAPISWGGPRLLFQTVLEALAVFRREAPPAAWLQIVCDRSFPLMPLWQLAERMADPRTVERQQFLPLLPCWHGELTEDQVAHLPERLGAAVDAVFGKADGAPLEALAGHWDDQYPDFRLQRFTFNFQDRSISLNDDQGRLDGQSYAVSPFDMDVKWMSFSRLHQFIDTAPENGPTYARTMDPHTSAWVHDTLEPLTLRQGDPFGMLSRRLADALLDDPKFHHIAAAFQAGFGPEMNYFDSMAATLGLPDDFVHPYKRSNSDWPAEDQIRELYHGADVEGHGFVRKVDADHSRAVQQVFADRGRDTRSWRQTEWVCVGGGERPDEASIVLDHQLLAVLVSMPVRIRDLFGRSERVAAFSSDGRLTSEDGAINARWSFVEGGLVVDFLRAPHGAKRFTHRLSDGERLILAPTEPVGAFNEWSLFLSFDLAAIAQSLTEPTQKVIYVPLPGPSLRWFGAANEGAAWLAAITPRDRSMETPCLVAEGVIIEWRETKGGWLALAMIDECPALLRWRGFSIGAGPTTLSFARACEDDAEAWAHGRPLAPTCSLDSATMPGNWRIDLLDRSYVVNLDPSGLVWGLDGAPAGRWLWRGGTIDIFGLPGIGLGRLTHASLRDGDWRWAGRGAARLGHEVFFSLTRMGP